MDTDRRSMFTAGLLASLAGMVAGPASASAKRASASPAHAARIPAASLGLKPHPTADRTRAFQRAIQHTCQARAILELPAGRFILSTVNLPDGAMIEGVPGQTTLAATAGDQPLLRGESAKRVSISGVWIEGAGRAVAKAAGLVHLSDVGHVDLTRLEIANSRARGLVLERCGGNIGQSTFNRIADVAVFALDCRDLDVESCRIADCGNNGIQIWRTQKGRDGSRIANNRISRIRADAGGNGQNGNAINVFRADDVMVTGNHIEQAAFTAVRGNAASNFQVVANHARGCGEVAIYAEFGFEGALINANLIDGAATGIEVTNFNEGGRLAVVQGNLIRNLLRRENDPEDKRGDGIFVEADASVSGNTIENAPTSGIQIGWGDFCRNVSATGNVIRNCGVGIAITRPEGGGRADAAVQIATNLIAAARHGAIRERRGTELAGPDLALPGASASTTVGVTANIVSQI